MHGTGQMGKIMRALGLMSGTSLDGIDVAFIETDGDGVLVRGPAQTFPYDAEMRRLLVRALADAKTVTSRDARPGCMAEAEREVTERHSQVVGDFIAHHEIARASIDVIGFHGQTVLHRPKDALTIQLGLGALLAEKTGLPVVSDLRAADVAAGGQGAPLVPVYHQALVAKLAQRPVAVVNIGGVANVTWIGRTNGHRCDGRLIAFDTGPGNALLDDWMMKRAGIAFDEDGRTSGAGRVHEDVVHFYLNHEFFSSPPPKSLDRNAYFSDLIDGLSLEDGAATLAAFTASAIVRAREHMPEEPELWIIGGGGRRNRTIMSLIAGRVQCAVVPAEAVGLDGDSIEAEAWAYLAVRSLKGLPITFPGTTGVAQPMCGGVHARPNVVTGS
jgi:anhydro-N-acetylmuramic acid kinase